MVIPRDDQVRFQAERRAKQSPPVRHHPDDFVMRFKNGADAFERQRFLIADATA
jgi:hypothetical protein